MAILRTQDYDPTWVSGGSDDHQMSRSLRVISLTAALFTCLGIWAYLALLDEVSTGAGRVVPTTKEQVVESLEGGILSTLHVRQDQIVEPGQLLAQLDPTITESDVGESAAKYRAALASTARLEAEVNLTTLAFPPALDDYSELRQRNRALYRAPPKPHSDTALDRRVY